MKSRPILLTLLLALVLAACGGTATAEIQLVSASDAAAVLDDRAPEVVLLDVRTPEEFNEVRVPGSINVDFYAADFASQLDTLSKDVPYVVYCRSGNRSSQTMDIMRDLGFTEVWDVDGGIISWNEAGLPLEN
ncbi:MAG: rhodanese-like domain-containing protein [Acidimicrobiia bacterium]|nr:rhodanese-like domain-containing protein [Acidimicrobiia bacterium]NNF89504.1 rhodanese-like domain-containing protein [Acidimicrobiia bacterium]NNL97376.1 rhodanese-like domain-containing protein [Acidimicrobiia bacterium]RZV46979.1 MAG: rhodanese-like domain-containing protein [Acidimicrobiia bacterium]